MCSKKTIKKKITELFLLLLIVCVSASAKSNQKKYLDNVFDYLNKINEFSSSFLQTQNNDISEGVLSIKNKRLRIEYISPTRLVFVLKKNKGMFFNKDLQEVKYFNPQNTAGQFLLDLFNDQEFLLDAKVRSGSGYFYLSKKIHLDDVSSKIEIYFEENPFQLRKIRIIGNEEIISFAIINPDFNPYLNDKLFSLANPMLRQ